MQFPQLFSPINIGSIEIKNRVFSSGHQTLLAQDSLPTPAMAAYHEARAKGGVGLIITECVAVDETSLFNSAIIKGYRDETIPGYRLVTDAIHRHGAKVFGQLFHGGSEIPSIKEDGTKPVVWSTSAFNHERYNVSTSPLTEDMIERIISGYCSTAVRMIEGGYDGVEIMASHGYLPAQFISARRNERTDKWGGSERNRHRFILEIARRLRLTLPADRVVGLRISLDEEDHLGMNRTESLAAIQALEREGLVDYVNVTMGTSANNAAAAHIVPHMAFEAGYMQKHGATVKKVIKSPTLVTGRFNQPQLAEAAIAAGDADMIGMTRAQIVDPEMVNKAREGRIDDIRACIACNQACIGHDELGVPISCIQYPESGRELLYGTIKAASGRRKIIVAGGGPAGMKAASVAAKRGHAVTLYEAASQLGGQARLAQLLPGRAEFGGIIANLEREMELAGVTVHRNSPVTHELIKTEAPDAVVIATGALPFTPQLEIAEGHIVTAWQVLTGEEKCGGNVVIADWRADWIGLGVAQKLASEGHRVKLMTSAYAPGINIFSHLRDYLVGQLTTLGVTIVPYARLAGVDTDTAYFEQKVTGEAIVVEEIDSVVLALGHRSNNQLLEELADTNVDLHVIGDALNPRTAEEAVLEGLVAGTSI